MGSFENLIFKTPHKQVNKPFAAVLLLETYFCCIDLFEAICPVGV